MALQEGAAGLEDGEKVLGHVATVIGPLPGASRSRAVRGGRYTPGWFPLSAVLIAQNEEGKIGRALASVGFCDEIVVVDSGSTDATREVAEAAGARVLIRTRPGLASWPSETTRSTPPPTTGSWPWTPTSV